MHYKYFKNRHLSLVSDAYSWALEEEHTYRSPGCATFVTRHRSDPVGDLKTVDVFYSSLTPFFVTEVTGRDGSHLGFMLSTQQQYFDEEQLTEMEDDPWEDWPEVFSDSAVRMWQLSGRLARTPQDRAAFLANFLTDIESALPDLLQANGEPSSHLPAITRSFNEMKLRLTVKE